MSRISKHGAFLQYLVQANPKERKKLIKNASKVEINSVCEVCKNILAGRIPLKGQQHRRFCRFKNIVRKLANRRIGLETKRRILQQQRGGALLPLLAPLVIPLISGLISKIRGT